MKEVPTIWGRWDPRPLGWGRGWFFSHSRSKDTSVITEIRRNHGLFWIRQKFNKSVSNIFLLNFCQVNFVWISPCDTETYIVFLCYYAHDSIVFIIAMFNCFITLLQHVRGQSALCCQIDVCNSLTSRVRLSMSFKVTGRETDRLAIVTSYCP